MKRLIFLLCFLIAIPLMAQPITFSENATLLTYDNHELWVSLSDSGNTLVATANQYEPTNEENTQFRISHRAIALWDITTLPDEGGIVQPTATYDIATDARIGTSLAPNDRYIALLINDQLQIMSVPELDVLEVFPEFASTDASFWFDSGGMDWSLDGELLATIAGGKILLWDGDSLQTLIETDAERIYATPNGWLLHTFNDTTTAFLECDRLFDSCVTYTESEETLERTEAYYVPALDMLYVSRKVDGFYLDRYSVWTRDLTGGFQQQAWIVEDGYPNGFSTSGTYLVSRVYSQELNLFWRVNDVSEPAFAMPFRPMGRSFLPGDEFVIEFSDAGADPFLISVYDLNNTLQSTYNLTNQFDLSGYFVLDLLFSAVRNNRYYLGLGNAVVVIPLEEG